jgi:hypothetical protein
VADSWFSLSPNDQREALEVAAASTGRPAHLLEKDIWVVWTLAAIYESDLASKLTFKGGTSLSKAYKIIDRFSEDIDLTYDIRQIVPDLLRDGITIPPSRSQADKITNNVKARLPGWIEASVQPLLAAALSRDGLEATLTLAGDARDKLILAYPPIRRGTGYAPPTIQLEFGARATGEPNELRDVACDIAAEISGVAFPTAKPLVMQAERTFWEKATAAHVFSRQGTLGGARYSRHWYDLAALHDAGYAQKAIANASLGMDVAAHKSMFFRENDSSGSRIDYRAAVTGSIQIAPEAGAFESLRADYAAMLEDGLLSSHQPSFDEVMGVCQILQDNINGKG